MAIFWEPMTSSSSELPGLTPGRKGKGGAQEGEEAKISKLITLKHLIPPLEFSDVMCAEGLCLLVLLPFLFPLPPSLPSLSMLLRHTPRKSLSTKTLKSFARAQMLGLGFEMMEVEFSSALHCRICVPHWSLPLHFAFKRSKVTDHHLFLS